MKRYVFILVIILVPSLMMAQASGGQIVRKKNSSRNVVHKSNTNKSNIIKTLINNMVYVEGGSFDMGAIPGGDNTNKRQVTLSSFYISKYEVTQEEWELVKGNNPSSFKGKKRPVNNVSWDECLSFVRILNQVTGMRFRLPTEAEWEYAARGGIKTKGYIYSGGNNLENVGWFKANSANSSHPVGQLEPNELGLYDMSGNVYEWCSDKYDNNGSKRVSRGGCFYSNNKGCITSNHDGGKPDASPLIGFRLACDNL